MRSVPRFFAVMVTLCCCVGCDQVSKSAARALLSSGITESLFADSLRLQLVQNPVGIGSFRTGIFNLADMAILAGALLLVLRRYAPPPAAPPSVPAKG